MKENNTKGQKHRDKDVSPRNESNYQAHPKQQERPGLQMKQTFPKTFPVARSDNIHTRPIARQSAARPRRDATDIQNTNIPQLEEAAIMPKRELRQRHSDSRYMSAQKPLTTSLLAAVETKEQKQIPAERLHPLIQRMCPDHAERITGMLLANNDNDELLHMLESTEFLKAKVKEAVAVLRTQQEK